MKKNTILFSLVILGIVLPARAGRFIHFNMEGDATSHITETHSGDRIRIYSQHGVENIPGAVGEALRFDGYTTYATGSLSAAPASREAMTVSLWVAPETYPIVKHDEATTDKIILAGTLDDNAKKGWAFMLGSNGSYSFVCYTGGWRTEVEAEGSLPRYEWSRLVATVDGSRAVLYRNGEPVKEARSLGTIDDSSRTIFIGKGSATSQINGFNLNTFNGLIDDLEVFDTFEDAIDMGALASNPADLSIPESRYAFDLLRPRFHGMPATGWTNESHGMTFSDGKFHVFFQKNANGPYMSRLHWGHISSPDLINWTEEKIALFPELSYDIKGCWSGCVFTDDVVSEGVPNIIYTGVDYVKAYIGQAKPADESLIDWEKRTNPIINGRPAGLSDDFRDPYFFRNGENAYIIVGTSKDGIGATTLHKYISLTGTWTNNAGDIFFAGTDKASCGTFWEMPNITPMGNDKWLFTTTPQNTGVGVRTLYWTGTIASDGKFVPDAASSSPRGVELISKDGYGLLSPTIYRHEGKTIVLGIVPDKLPGNINYTLGWAHCYSLPREWSLDEKGNLCQKPYSGLADARLDVRFNQADFTLDGETSLDPVSGRQIELLGRFQVGNSPVGFKFFQSQGSEATLKYIPSANMLTVDLTKLNRTSNDNGSYNGLYSCVLPESLPAGSELKLNVFIDGSVMDIFVNDRWATSMRVFPSSEEADGASVFSDGPVKVNEISAWNLNAASSGIQDIFDDTYNKWEWNENDDIVNVYDLRGTLLKTRVSNSEATVGLPAGIYLVGNRKVIVK